jgi:hypothetical protein
MIDDRAIDLINEGPYHRSNLCSMIHRADQRFDVARMDQSPDDPIDTSILTSSFIDDQIG